MNNVEKGKAGEQIAANYFTKMGYNILVRNFRVRGGEVDLIVEKEGVVSAVEVKLRGSGFYGRPEESVGRVKLLRIRAAFLSYLRENRVEAVRIGIIVFGIRCLSVKDFQQFDLQKIEVDDI